jgi:hypothetical protein
MTGEQLKKNEDAELGQRRAPAGLIEIVTHEQV